MADIGIIKFQVAGIQFGMYAEHILEIIRLGEYRRIPQPLPYVIGLIELRNYIVTVVDLRRRLGLSSISELAGSTVIVVNIASRMFGLTVESISDFRHIPEDHILPPISVAGFPEQLLQGVIAEKNDIMMIPNLDKIFSSFMKVQLLPITPAEKIAFQYRFTPGSLIRTLENTLMQEQALNYKIVNKLPRSMCLPSSVVHKVITYYSDFLPEKHEEGARQEPWTGALSQRTHAGDETYLSLSQQLLAEEEEDTEQNTQPISPKVVQTNHSIFQPDSRFSRRDNLERFLHRLVQEYAPEKPGTLPRILTSHIRLAKRFARAVNMSPLTLTTYLSYYARETTQPEEPGEPQEMSLEQQIQELCDDMDGFEQVLQKLGQEQTTLNIRHARQIAEYYQIPMTVLSRMFFTIPGLSYEPEPESEPHEFQEEQEEQEPGTDFHPAALQQDIAACLPRKRAVSECLHALAKHHNLEDHRIIRSVAAQLRVPTCRVSKLRSYYHFE